MQTFTLDRAQQMAGVDRDDDPFVRDQKLDAWLKLSKGRVVHTPDHPDQAVIIIEENK